jgi:hypothetical protein
MSIFTEIKKVTSSEASKRIAAAGYDEMVLPEFDLSEGAKDSW